MALLTLQYTAPLPAGFTSGTVEVKSGAVYIDAAGRVNQPYRKYALNADKSLTSLQGDATPVIVGMAMGDPATAPPLDVVVTINVSGLPTPLRSTFRVTPVDVTGAGTLNLHAPSLTVPVVGPYSPTLQGLIDGATGQQAAVAGAITGANSAAAGANAAAAAVPGTVDAALVPITQALADSAQAVAAKPDALAAAAAKPDALAAAAAKPDAQAAAALLPSLQAGAVTASQLGAIPTAVKGLRVDTQITGEQGGSLWSFTQDATALTSATLSVGEQGGLLYDLTGGL
jgi:hypothetical protein